MAAMRFERVQRFILVKKIWGVRDTLKVKLKVFLAGHNVAMVTYSVTKIIPMCSPIIGQFFDTMTVASTDKEW